MNYPAGFRNRLTRLEEALESLPDKVDETAENTLLALWAATQVQPLALSQLDGWKPAALDADQSAHLDDLITQRLNGVPLAHLTGRQSFMGIVLKASPAALVPRKETELLGNLALEKVRACECDRPLVIDTCTGAGNVALALAVLAPQARVLGADLSAEAVALAQENAAFLDRPDVDFRRGDLLAPFDSADFLGRVDVLTCNPPYISSAKVPQMAREISAYEPPLAFDGGPFGVKIVRRLIVGAPEFLRPGGWLVFEVGLGQGEPMSRILERDNRYDRIESRADHNKYVRALAARRA